MVCRFRQRIEFATPLSDIGYTAAIDYTSITDIGYSSLDCAAPMVG